MPIIQPGILPAPPVTPRFGDYLGEGFASGVGTGTDLLLKALLSGQLQRQPFGGQYTAPMGATTPISPAERTMQGGIPLAQLLQQQGPGTLTPTQYGRFQLQPGLEHQLQQQKLETERKNQALYDAWAKSLKPWNSPQVPSGNEGNEFLKGLSDLSTKAYVGDENAVSRIRLIRQLMQTQ